MQINKIRWEMVQLVEDWAEKQRGPSLRHSGDKAWKLFWKWSE